jgi:hypothetical protein
MTRLICLPAYAAAMAAVFCLASLTPTFSNQAVAQQFWVPGNVQVYYGSSPRYSSGYATGYNRYGYTGYGYGPYGYGSSTQYGYGSSVQYGYPSSSGYSYSSGRSLHYRGVRLYDGSYRPVYNPNTTRYYSPYGYAYPGY